MPQLHEIIKKTSDTKKDKVFEKKSYRPWDLQGDTSSSPSSISKVEQNKIEPQEINRAQIGHEPDTNRVQIGHTTEHDIRHKSGTNRAQNKIDSNPTQNKTDTNRAQIEHTTGHDIRHKSGTNRTQICDKNSISSLTGIQRKSLFFIHENICQTSSKISDPLNQIHIADGIKCKIGSVKTSIRRLEDKLFIIREEYWPGRSGWSKYRIPANIHTQIIEYQNSSLKNKSDTISDTNRTQIGYKSDTQPDTQPDTTASSSSSNFLNSKTTTNYIALPENWLDIDYEALSELGFGKNQLMQLYKLNLEPEIVQASLWHFAFDLSRNKKREQIKTNPLSYFMGIMRREGCYNAPENYVSPKQQALRRFAEQQKREQEALARLEEEAKEPHFQAWLASLTPAEAEHLIPDHIKQMKLTAPRSAFLNAHFTTTVWPAIRSTLGIKEILA